MNEALRRAIRESGLTFAQVAERVYVDVKTVERWIWRDRVPHPSNRRALAELLQRDEADLWPWGHRANIGSESGHRIRALEGHVAALEMELRRSESLLWRLAVSRAIPLLGRDHVLVYEIGESPADDIVIDTRYVEAAQAEQQILWLLFAIAASGDSVPPKLGIRELERIEAWELLEDGMSRPSLVHDLGFRDGWIWAMVVLDRERPVVRSRVLWSWAGVWNQLRSIGRDRSTMDLRPLVGSPLPIVWDKVSVAFRFPKTARGPEVWPVGRPDLVPEMTTDEDGRTTYLFHLSHPELLLYTWNLGVDGFGPA